MTVTKGLGPSHLGSQNRIVVGLSGGLYSAVAASLLKSQGYHVLGVHLVASGAQSQSRLGKLRVSCVNQQSQSLQQAQIHAKKLGISLEILELDSLFDEKWIDGLLHGLLQNGTPNPCRICKGDLLISGLFQAAQKLLGEPNVRVATGHAARITEDHHTGEHILQCGTDRSRDQSYWLARIPEPLLNKMMFPVGDLSIRLLERLAAESGISVEGGSTHSGVEVPCLGRTPEVLTWVEGLTPPSLRKPGSIRTPGGSHMGAHDGLFRHHLGQKLQSAETSPEKQDVFVVGLDRMKNSVLVGNISPMVSTRWLLRNALWRRRKTKASGELLQFSFQSRGDRIDGKVTSFDGGVVRLEIPSGRPLSGVVGQFLVFYEGDEVILSAELDQPWAGA